MLAGVRTEQPHTAAATDSRQQQEHELQAHVQDAIEHTRQGSLTSAQQKQAQSSNQALQSNTNQVFSSQSLRSAAQPASLSQHLETQQLQALLAHSPNLQQQQLLRQPSPQEGHMQQPHTSWPKFERPLKLLTQPHQPQQLGQQQQGIGQQGAGEQGILGPQGFRQQATGRWAGQQGIGQRPTVADESQHVSCSMSGIPIGTDVPSRSVSAELHAIQRQLLSQQSQKMGAEGIMQVIYHPFHLTNAKSHSCTLCMCQGWASIRDQAPQLASADSHLCLRSGSTLLDQWQTSLLFSVLWLGVQRT